MEMSHQNSVDVRAKALELAIMCANVLLHHDNLKVKNVLLLAHYFERFLIGDNAISVSSDIEKDENVWQEK